MNSTQIKCFLEAVESLNFTAAAGKLFISQPALSRNIAALEAELDVLLFERKNNVLTLTPGGEIMYRCFRDLKTSVSAAVDKAKIANQESSNELRMGFVHMEMPTKCVADAIAKFKIQRPNTTLDISHYYAKEMTAHLVEHVTDMAVMIGSAVYGNSRLQYTQVSDCRRCILAPITHPLAGVERVPLSSFSGDCFISVKPTASPTMTPMIQRVCGQAGFSPRIMETESTTEMANVVESGKGVALVCDNTAHRFNPLFKIIDLEEELPVSLICVWDRLNRNPEIRSFIAILQSVS